MYTLSARRFEDFQLQDNKQRGGLLRLQAQLNFQAWHRGEAKRACYQQALFASPRCRAH